MDPRAGSKIGLDTNLVDSSILSDNEKVVLGADALDPTLAAFATFKADVDDYNGEAFSQGDYLIGDNSSGENNIASKSGTMAMRHGTSNIVAFDQTGINLQSGALTLNRSSTTVSSGNVDLDDGLALSINTSFLKITSSTGDFTLRGIATPINGAQLLVVFNATGNNMTLKDNGTPAIGYSKIRTYAGDVSTTGAGVATLIYDDDGIWLLLSIQG